MPKRSKNKKTWQGPDVFSTVKLKHISGIFKWPIKALKLWWVTYQTNFNTLIYMFPNVTKMMFEDRILQQADI